MAKADDALSDRIWLREALALAIAAFGSEALAKERLREWMADGKLPWSCMSWKALDAEGIARLEQENRTGSVFFFNTASVVYHEGDPQFWRTGLTIDWKDNGAREKAAAGAKALGVKVSRARLLELLPHEHKETPEPEPNPPEPERVEVPAPTKPAVAPKVWLGKTREKYPPEPGEGTDAYARRLYGLMQKPDAGVTKVWTFKNFKRRLYDE